MSEQLQGVSEVELKWALHVAKWRNCQECNLCTQRNRIVLARGDLPCDVLFVGEAPGQSEDVRGIPFDGPAGQLLDKICHRAFCSVPKRRDDTTRTLTLHRWAFTNLVACYPREAKERGDNEPEMAEIRACAPRLREFVTAIAQPRIIVAVGTLANDWICVALPEPQWLAKKIHIVHPAHILARLPLAQKDMAVRNAIAIIIEALEKLEQSTTGVTT